jgi:hypothetical protein
MRVRLRHVDHDHLSNRLTGEVRKTVYRESFVDQHLEDGTVFVR